MSAGQVFVPVGDLWNWFDVGAYIDALVAARSAELARAIRESAWFPHAAGESRSVGLFQQTTGGWGRR